MASWSDKQFNSQLVKCPVCMCMISNKRLHTHSVKCYESKKAQMDSIGVIQCPFMPHHIMPISFFNHHLEGNCQGVQNLLRKFYQKGDQFPAYKEAPQHYKAFIPDQYLNRQNKNLLYMLEQDLFGHCQEEEDEGMAEETPSSDDPQPSTSGLNPNVPNDVD